MIGGGVGWGEVKTGAMVNFVANSVADLCSQLGVRVGGGGWGRNRVSIPVNAAQFKG